MILLGSALINFPVMSLQTGGQIGTATKPLIDPTNLAIMAYFIDSPLIKHSSLLRLADVRELSDMGFIVDSIDELIAPDDVLKIKTLVELNFVITGMSVRNEKGSKLGKVTDYTLDTSSFIIQQLTVHRPLFHSFNDTELVIHRSQIIEINDTAIIVHSQAKAPEPERSQVVSSYVNPFRRSNAAESTEQN
ncbi:MAG: hypothetical protein WAQ22_02885 [Candidatus Saccharimonas sp.]